MDFAERKGRFGLEELFSALGEIISISQSSIKSTLSRLVASEKLVRVGRGQYEKPSELNNQVFSYTPGKKEMKLFYNLVKKFPFAEFCIFSGEAFSSFLHHLSYNAVTYVETERDVAESVFDFLKDLGYKVFLNPDSDFVHKYIDIREACVIVKTLVSEAPVSVSNGLPVPTIEKLLVDIMCESDLLYLRSDASNIFNVAKSNYVINISRLNRYARRRGLSINSDWL